MQHLKTPVDLLSPPCLTKDMVQQAIETAYPYDKQGFIIWGPTAPDVVTTPVLAYFLWGKTDENYIPIQEFYYYDKVSAWKLLPIVNGALLADGSVPLSKLSLTGAQPKFIIQVNAAGTELVFISIPDAIDNNTIPPVKLLTPSNVGKYVLTSIEGAKAFQTFANFLAALDDNTLPLKALVGGTSTPFGRWLRTNPDGTKSWEIMDINWITAAGVGPGQSVKRNAGNTGWDPYTPVTPALTKVGHNENALAAIPAAAGVVSFEHNLQAIPKQIQVFAVCQPAGDENNYAENDRIDINTIFPDGSDLHMTVSCNATHVYVTFPANNLHVLDKTAGTVAAFTRANWKLLIYAYA